MRENDFKLESIARASVIAMFLFFLLINSGYALELDQYSEAMRNAALKKAKELNVSVAVVVMDLRGGNVFWARTSPGAAMSFDIAYQKALQVIITEKPTGSEAGIEESPITLNSALLTRRLPFKGILPFAGGIPIKSSGKLVGAIGVSGAKSSEDVKVAEACAAVIPNSE